MQLTVTTTWMDAAECRGMPPSVFVPSIKENGRTPKPSDEARAVCARCPVRQECLDYGIAIGGVGLWGNVYLVQSNATKKKPKANEPRTCPGCGVVMDNTTASPSAIAASGGRCRSCLHQKYLANKDRPKPVKKTTTLQLVTRGPAPRPVPLCSTCKEPLTVDNAPPSILVRAKGNCRPCAGRYMKRRYWKLHPRPHRPGMVWMRLWSGGWRQVPAPPPEPRCDRPEVVTSRQRRGRRPLQP